MLRCDMFLNDGDGGKIRESLILQKLFENEWRIFKSSRPKFILDVYKYTGS